MAKLTKQNIPFTQVANEVLNDKTLSWKAKGIFAYLFSKPPGWDFSFKRIAENGADGKSIILTGLKELESHGYLERRKQRSGKMEYALKYAVEPDTENRNQASKVKTRILQLAKIGTISNKEEKVIKNIPPLAKNFFESRELQGKLLDWLAGKKIPRDLAESELKKFIAYWNEPNQTGSKVRWQSERFFDIRRRLATWFTNVEKFNKNKKSTATKFASMPS